VFVKVAQRAMRRIALEVFHHLHALSLRFHLERQTGGLTRDIERGTRGISTLLSFMVFSVLPTLLEIALVTGFLIVKFDVWFGVICVAALVLYVALTFTISEWRTAHRRQMNEMDSKANTKAIDSLLNYETVKYFGNEHYEARRYDDNLQRYEHAVVTSETFAGAVERRAGGDHRARGFAPHVARGRRHRRGQALAGRPRDGECAADPALHPAQFPGRHVPRDQAGDGRHGEDVPAPGREPGGRGQAGREAARRERRGHPLRERRLQLRPPAADTERRELRGPRRAQGRRGGPERLGQVHDRAASSSVSTTWTAGASPSMGRTCAT
jgi:hypothetical protein